MGLIVTLILGAIAGWLASMITNRDQSMGAVLNILVGILGAFLANMVLAPLVGISATLNTFSLSGFLMSVAGAVLLLVAVNLVTKRSIT